MPTLSLRAQEPPPAAPPAEPAADPTAEPPDGGATAGIRSLPAGLTPETQQAIDRGLAYLARVQGRQGSWQNQEAYGSYPVAMTSLAGLALLMDGNTTTQGRYAQHVDRAARYLMDSPQPSGLIERGDGEGRPMFGHGYAMLFLGELYGMTEDARRSREIHGVLERAVLLTDRSQSQLGGWIYTPDGRSDEGAVTITQLQGLRSCRNAGVAVPKTVIDRAMGYLEKSQNSDGGIRYSLTMGGPGSRPPITAAAVCCWFNAGQYDEPRALRALDFAKRHIRPSNQSGGHYYYAHLYMAQALWISRDAEWNVYYEGIRDYLLSAQNADGSWDGDGVGKIYGTSIALIILQLPLNLVPIMQR
jgi:hypothetical protein